MRECRNKIIKTLLSSIAVTSVLAFTSGVNVYASDANEDTNDKTIRINNLEELIAFSKESESNSFKGTTIVLEKNIILNDSWSDIGNSKVAFEGTFDGNGYSIQNFDSKWGSDAFINTIGKDGVVKNLGIKGKISKVFESNIGSIAGINNGYIVNCYNLANMYATNSIGGLVAYNNGVIENSYNRGNVDAVMSMGGIALKNTGIINNCYTTAEVGWGLNHDAIVDKNTGVVKNTYWNTDNEKKSSVASVENDVVGMSTSEMKSVYLLDKLNNNAQNITEGKLWELESYAGYPKLVDTSVINISDTKNGKLTVTNNNKVVTNGTKVVNNSELVVNVEADKDYEIESLTCNGKPIENGQVVKVTEDLNVEAKFSKIVKEVTINEVENGTISVFNGDKEVITGDKIAIDSELTVKVTPNDGYSLYYLDVNGSEILSGDKVVVNDDITINVEIRKDETKVYFINSDNWSNPYVYVYNKVNGVVNKNAAWPGIEMTYEGNGLYSYVLPEELKEAKVIFNDNGNNKTQIPGRLRDGLDIKETMIYDNGNWTNYDDKNLALNIREIATDKKSPQPIERLIDITSYVEGGKEPYTYKYYVNGNELVSEGNKAQWLPTEIGQYNILVEVTDRRGNTVTKEITYDIKDKSLFQTTIFYKGYTNPYIKYSVAGRDWTPNNGILMTKSETREGYYEATIDLENEGEVVDVCFTNGKGSWDSKAGQNYKFTAGKYIYKSGYITEIKENQENIVKVYYKGYENPYIHYCIAGGEWTEVPGVKMEKSLDREGYYEITIDLGDVTSAEVCFNDGKGNWDNNKGANYRITSGEAVIH